MVAIARSRARFAGSQVRQVLRTRPMKRSALLASVGPSAQTSVRMALARGREAKMWILNGIVEIDQASDLGTRSGSDDPITRASSDVTYRSFTTRPGSDEPLTKSGGDVGGGREMKARKEGCRSLRSSLGIA